MTEHGVYLRERYLALRSGGDFTWPVRYAFPRLSRAVCSVAYDEAELLTPVSEFMGGGSGAWAPTRSASS